MGERKNIKILHETLRDGESVEDKIVAFHDNKQGILGITNKRVLFVSKTLLFGLTVKDFSFESIHSIEYQIKLTESTLILSGPEEDVEFDVIPLNKESLLEFVELLKQKTEDANPDKEEHSANNNDYIDQLKRLAELKEQGILTDEEFQEQKAKLLNLS